MVASKFRAHPTVKVALVMCRSIEDSGRSIKRMWVVYVLNVALHRITECKASKSFSTKVTTLFSFLVVAFAGRREAGCSPSNLYNPIRHLG